MSLLKGYDDIWICDAVCTSYPARGLTCFYSAFYECVTGRGTLAEAFHLCGAHLNVLKRRGHVKVRPDRNNTETVTLRREDILELKHPGPGGMILE